MEEQKPAPNKLIMPSGMSAVGPVVDLSEAYIKSILALPELLAGIGEVLQDINDSLSVCALYYERKGKAEALISEDDLAKEDDDEQGPKAN